MGEGGEQAGDVTQLIEGLPNMHEALGSSLSSMETRCNPHTVTLTLRKRKQEDEEFKVNLSYIGSLEPAWATRDTVSK